MQHTLLLSTLVSLASGLLNTLRPRQNGRHFANDIFKCIFLNENVRISINISLNFVPKGLINNTPTLVQIMAWRRPGDKPLSEPMMVNLLTHICVTRPQWVNDIPLSNWIIGCQRRWLSAWRPRVRHGQCAKRKQFDTGISFIEWLTSSACILEFCCQTKSLEYMTKFQSD